MIVNASIQRIQIAKMCARIMLRDARIPILIGRALVLFCGPLTMLPVRIRYLHFSIMKETIIAENKQTHTSIICIFVGETHVKMKGCFTDNNSCNNSECVDTSMPKKMNFCCCTGHMCNSKYTLIPTTTKAPEVDGTSKYHCDFAINRQSRFKF